MVRGVKRVFERFAATVVARLLQAGVPGAAADGADRREAGGV